MRESSSPRFLVYTLLVTAVAAYGAFRAWMQSPFTLGDSMVVLTLAAIVSDSLAVYLPNMASISLTYPIVVSAVILAGPAAGAFVAAASTLVFLTPQSRMPPLKLVFNLSQTVLSALVAGALFLFAGGRLLGQTPLEAGELARLALPLTFAATAGFIVNFTLTGFAFAMVQGVSLRSFWRSTLWMVPSQLALGMLGVLIAQVMAAVGSPGLLLFVVPLVVARQTYQRYLRLRDAYADTVRSLVAAIEAKDPYTRGHSVRVAAYTVDTARAVGMSERDIEQLEHAALLHDLGKVAVRGSVLSKPGGLSAEELAEVREHPEVGARILSTVPYLAEIVPVVRYHHECFDGSGYCAGLQGSQIPLGARVLAVADSYDAMTSQRPYRGAMPQQDAIAELRARSGTQFDGGVVSAFLGVIAHEVGDSEGGQQ